MAVYDFKCHVCGNMVEDVVLSMKHTPHEKPRCCGGPMQYHITTAPTVHWKDYDVNYVPVSVKPEDRVPITSRRQEREFMKRHDLVHADFSPPTPDEEFRAIAETKASIDAITPPKEIEAEVRERMDIV